MEIKTVKFYENGFMTQPFAFGGGEDASRYDANVKYPSCLQNFLIDMGNEIILVDTGLSKETKDTEPNEKTQIFLGTRKSLTLKVRPPKGAIIHKEGTR